MFSCGPAPGRNLSNWVPSGGRRAGAAGRGPLGGRGQSAGGAGGKGLYVLDSQGGLRLELAEIVHSKP